MDAEEIISLAVRAMQQALKAIEQAQDNDLTSAMESLRQSRSHFDQAVSDWDAAGQGTLESNE